jgi:hypothetical protein
MKTPVELRTLYKVETGNCYNPITWAFEELESDSDTEWSALTIQEYIDWLESKVIEMTEKANEAIKLHDYKEDYEDAIYQIGQLEDELYDAKDEIRELNSKT